MCKTPPSANPRRDLPGRFAPQEHSYDFPHHYLTALEGESGIRIHRELKWGLRDFVPVTAGVDPSAKAIAFARAFNPYADVMAGDVAQVSAQHDVVTAVEVFEHVPDEEVGPFAAVARHHHKSAL